MNFKTKKMKVVLIILVGIAVYFLLFRYPSVDFNVDAPDGIQFHKGSWQQVIEKAQQENKIIFLDMYATWCGPCKRLKSKTFASQDVGNYFNQHFINVAFDAEEGEGLELAEKYGVVEYPTLLFINPQGEVVFSTVGYHDSTELIGVGKSVKAKSNI